MIELKGNKASFAKRIQEIKCRIYSCGKSGSNFRSLCEDQGLSDDQSLAFIAHRVLTPNKFIFSQETAHDSRSFYLTDQLRVYSSILNINCYFYSCWDLAIEDSALTTVTETFGIYGSDGLTHSELNGIDKCSHHFIDRLVNCGVLVKGWVMPIPQINSSRTSGTCVMFHLRKYVDYFNAKAFGLLYHPNDSIRTIILQFLHSILIYNNLSTLPCENMAKYLGIDKRQMQYLRNHVSSMMKQGSRFPIRFELKKTATLTKFGRIGSVRKVWCVLTSSSLEPKIGMRYENIPLFDQLDLLIRNKNGITSTEIRSRTGLSRKRAFKISQEFISSGSYPKVKTLENKTSQYVVLPKNNTPTTSSSRTTTAPSVEISPEDDSATAQSKKRKAEQSQDEKDASHTSSLNKNTQDQERQNFILEFIKSETGGIAWDADVFRALREHWKQQYGESLERKVYVRSKEKLVKSGLIEACSLSLSEEESLYFDNARSIELLVFPMSSADSNDVRKVNYLHRCLETKSPIIANNSKKQVKKRTKANSYLIPTSTSQRSDELKDIMEEYIVEIYHSEPLPQSVDEGVYDNRVLVQNDVWTKSEDVELLTKFIDNLVVRKARNGLPPLLKPSRKPTKALYIVHPKDSSFDFNFRSVELNSLRNFYILNATTKIELHTLSSCRRRMSKFSKELTSLHHLLTKTLQMRFVLQHNLSEFDRQLYNFLLFDGKNQKPTLTALRGDVLKKLTCSYERFSVSLFNDPETLDPSFLRLVLKELYLHGLIHCDSNEASPETEPTLCFTFAYQKSLIERWLGGIYYQLCFAAPENPFTFEFENGIISTFHHYVAHLLSYYDVTSLDALEGRRSSQFSLSLEISEKDKSFQVHLYEAPQEAVCCETHFNGVNQVESCELIDLCQVALRFNQSSQQKHLYEKVKLIKNHSSLKSSGPWVNSDSSINFDSLMIYLTHVLAFISEFPGSSLKKVHSMLMVLSLVEVESLLDFMVDAELLKVRRASLSSNLLNPFDSFQFWEESSSFSEDEYSSPSFFEVCM